MGARPSADLFLGDAERWWLRAQGWRTTQRSMRRLSVMAVNIEMSTPMMSTSAKPLTADVPK